MARAASRGAETVVLVEGTVALRPEATRDAELASREVEVHVTDLEIVGTGADAGDPGGRGRRRRSWPPRSCGSRTACSTCAAPSCSGISCCATG